MTPREGMQPLLWMSVTPKLFLWLHVKICAVKKVFFLHLTELENHLYNEKYYSYMENIWDRLPFLPGVDVPDHSSQGQTVKCSEKYKKTYTPDPDSLTEFVKCQSPREADEDTKLNLNKTGPVYSLCTTIYLIRIMLGHLSNAYRIAEIDLNID